MAYLKALENTVALDRLRVLGVMFSMDDFGTGHSSLSYLKRLPADSIQVDKSSVKGLGESVEDTAIVRMVVEPAHTLGMEFIAKGRRARSRRGYYGRWAATLPKASLCEADAS